MSLSTPDDASKPRDGMLGQAYQGPSATVVRGAQPQMIGVVDMATHSRAET